VLSVCVEADWPHVSTLREYSLLRWGRRLRSTLPGHVAGDAFKISYDGPDDRKHKKFAMPLFVQLRTIEHDWGLQHSDNNHLADVIRARTFHLWRESKECSILQACRSEPGVPPFIRNEPRRVAGLRARLRFGVSNTRALQHERKLCDSPNCPHCPAELDTPYHIFFLCPRFDYERSQCTSALASLNLQFTPATLLSTDTTACSADALTITAKFISFVFAQRNL
jgi:hypothetical protein